jgi:hypothetical protein
MKQLYKIFLFVTFIVNYLLLYIAIVMGEYVFYVLFTITLVTLILYSFSSLSNNGLLLVLIAFFLYLRYIPIIKYNQPLYADSLGDLAVTRMLEEKGEIVLLEKSAVHNAQRYSGWPLLHIFALVTSKITGLSLFSIFTYYPPLIATSNFLFIYLISSTIFQNWRVGALTCLISATFAEKIFWETQMVRQNMAFSLAIMIIYLYIKNQVNKEMNYEFLLFIVLGLLPLAHHLTAIEIFIIFSVTEFATIIINLVKTKFIFNLNISKTLFPKPFRLTFLSLMCTLILSFWNAYPRDVIFPLILGRSYRILTTIFQGKTSGMLTERLVMTKATLDIFGILSYAKLLFLGVMTVLGIVLLTKSKNSFKLLISSFLLAPFSLYLITYLLQKGTEERHALFLIVPISILSSKSIIGFKKKWLLLMCVLLITFPSLFKIYTGAWKPTPTYLYDKSTSFNFFLDQKPRFVFRDDQTLTSTNYFTKYTDSYLIGDYYCSVALLISYEPYRVMNLYSSKNWLLKAEDPILIVQNEHFESLKPLYSKRAVIQYVNNHWSDRIYDNGKVTGEKIPIN